MPDGSVPSDGRFTDFFVHYRNGVSLARPLAQPVRPLLPRLSGIKRT